MMTTMAALMGTLPVAIGIGAGSEARQPLGLAVVGGLILSQASDALHHAGDLCVSGQSGQSGGQLAAGQEQRKTRSFRRPRAPSRAGRIRSSAGVARARTG